MTNKPIDDYIKKLEEEDKQDKRAIEQYLHKNPRTTPDFDFTLADRRTVAKWLRRTGNVEQKLSDDLAKRIKNFKNQKFGRERLSQFLTNYVDPNADLVLFDNVSQAKYSKDMDAERMIYIGLLNVGLQRQTNLSWQSYTKKDWETMLENIDQSKLHRQYRFNKKEISLIARSIIIFLNECKTKPKHRTPLHPLGQ